jgi:hypothetical protein
MQPTKLARRFLEDNSKLDPKKKHKYDKKYNKAKEDPKKAYYKPIKSRIACEIQIISADGIAYPEADSSFDPSKIVKRAIRVGLYYTTKKKYLANTVQINAKWKENQENIWTIPK